MNEPLHLGHRQRLKERLRKSGLGELPDYEIIELLLFLSIPRKDVKPLAKKMMQHFGSISQIINADEIELKKIPEITDSIIANIRVVKEIHFRANKEIILNKPIISSKDDLIKYLRSSIGHSKTENLKILLLDSKNRIIGDETAKHGSTNTIAIYPREIVKSAIFHNASAVIICHNHPSGNTKPSRSDIQQTAILKEALSSIDVVLHDHVIISASSYYSFKSNDQL